MNFINGMINVEFLGLSVTIVDAIIVLYLLIMAVIGTKQGFVKRMFKLFGTLAILVGAVLLTPTVAEFFIGPLGHFIEAPVYEWMSGLTTESGIQIFTQPFNWGDTAARSELLPMALSAMGVPAFVSGIITKIGLFNSVLDGVGEVALIDVLPAGIASLAITIITFVLLLIVLAIVVAVLKRFLDGLTKFTLFGAINRFLGLALAVFQAYVIVSILLVVVAYIPVPGIIETIQSQIEISTVAKFLAENNWIGNWLVSTILP